MKQNCRVFAEIPDGLDESWQHGALLGGMASPMNNFDMAKAFRLSAETLISRNTKEYEAYEILYPVLYLYRHAMELYLKAIVQPEKKNHDLASLAEQMESVVQKKFGDALPSEAKELIGEFRSYDPSSFRFRYGEGFIEGEYWVDFPKLKDRMGWLFDGLEKVRTHLLEVTS